MTAGIAAEHPDVASALADLLIHVVGVHADAAQGQLYGLQIGDGVDDLHQPAAHFDLMVLYIVKAQKADLRALKELGHQADALGDHTALQDLARRHGAQHDGRGQRRLDLPRHVHQQRLVRQTAVNMYQQATPTALLPGRPYLGQLCPNRDTLL